MFKIQTWRYGKVEVYFTHINPADKKRKYSNRPGTQCFIVKTFKKKDSVLIAHGSTHLHALDHNSYDKELGRKLALTRALKNLGLTKKRNKKMRAKFWKAYFGAKEEARQRARKENNG